LETYFFFILHHDTTLAVSQPHLLSGRQQLQDLGGICGQNDPALAGSAFASCFPGVHRCGLPGMMFHGYAGNGNAIDAAK
jgi:hypothetical protein